MTKFNTRIETECEYCHCKFIAKVRRAKYCSHLCKGRALAKPSKRDGSTGLWPKVCQECQSEFMSETKNKRFCPDCTARHEKESIRKWHRNNPEWQKNWNREHPDSVHASRRKWEGKNPDKVAAQEVRHMARKAEKRAENRRARAIEQQEELKLTAVKYAPASKLDPEEFLETLGIIRLTQNFCKCTRCNNEFYVARTETSARRNLVNYARMGKSPCPYCSSTPLRHSASGAGSRYEHELKKLYPNLSVRGFKPDWMCGKEIDLYDPVAKVGIEFHGMYAHAKMSGDDTGKHKKKADLCEKAGVQLIQIYESEWVQRKDCVIDRLDAIFHKEMTRIPARKLRVKLLENRKEHEMACRFMDTNHIQGRTSFQWGVALMDGNEPVAVCTFRFGTGYAAGGHAENTGKYWELNRFATKLHTCVQGGLSRCISAFWKAHPEVTEMFSFADRRWTCPTRSAYSSSGFDEVGRQRQNYLYTNLDPKEPLKNKQFLRKAKIASNFPAVYSDAKTELEMATELGFYRIYDAGKIKYRMKRPQ